MNLPSDLFISYNSNDASAVEEIARRLRERGLAPWLDLWELAPGSPINANLSEILNKVPVVIIIIGKHGIGPWQREEINAVIARRVYDRSGEFRVIPVLLSGVPRGDRNSLPIFLHDTVWVEFRDDRDYETSFNELLRGIHGWRQRGPRDPIAEGSPYRGLEYFDVEHTAFFHGRGGLTQWLIDNLRAKPGRSTPNRLIAIVGSSGSGKSSLARAGVIAKLKEGELPGSKSWSYVTMVPGSNPLEALATQLASLRGPGRTPQDVLDQEKGLRASDSALHVFTNLHALDKGRPDHQLVLLVDQFEEFFTLVPSLEEHEKTADHERRCAFVRNLLHAATVPEGKTILVLTIRAEFLEKCNAYPRLSQLFSGYPMEMIGPLDEVGLRDVIARPAWQAGGSVEPGLVDLLVKEMRTQPGNLPLLQFTLAKMWGQSAKMTADNYRDLGSLSGILDKHAENAFNECPPEEQQIFESLFMRLVQPGIDSVNTRRPVTLDALDLHMAATEPAAPRKAALASLIARLSKAETRLLVADQTTVEIAHEALISGWHRLGEWVTNHRDDVRKHQRLADAATNWHAEGKPVGLLYRTPRLDEAQKLRELYPDWFNARESEFIACSESDQQRERDDKERATLLLNDANQRLNSANQRLNNTNQRLKRTVVVTIILSILVLGVGWFAYHESAEHSKQLIEANTQQYEAEYQRGIVKASHQAAVDVVASIMSLAEQKIRRLDPTGDIRVALQDASIRLLQAVGKPGLFTPTQLDRVWALNYLSEGDLALEKGDSAAAMSNYSEALKLTKLNVNVDPSVIHQGDFSDLQNRVAKLLLQNGGFAEAEKLLGESYILRQQVVDSRYGAMDSLAINLGFVDPPPEWSLDQYKLASVRADLGDIAFMRRNLAQALMEYKHSLEHVAALDENLDDTDVGSAKLRVLAGIAATHLEMGHVDDALARYDELHSFGAELAEANRGHLNLRFEIAQAGADRARAYLRAGRTKDVSQYVDDAANSLGSLLQFLPTEPRYLDAVADLETLMADLAGSKLRFRDASAHLELANTITRELLAQDPQSWPWQSQACDILSALAHTNLSAEEIDLAAKYAEMSVATCETLSKKFPSFDAANSMLNALVSQWEILAVQGDFPGLDKNVEQQALVLAELETFTAEDPQMSATHAGVLCNYAEALLGAYGHAPRTREAIEDCRAANKGQMATDRLVQATLALVEARLGSADTRPALAELLSALDELRGEHHTWRSRGLRAAIGGLDRPATEVRLLRNLLQSVESLGANPQKRSRVEAAARACIGSA